MNYEDAYKALASEFRNEWGALTPVEWENQTFAQPKSLPWVRFSVQFGESEQIAACGAGGDYRHYGGVFVQIFMPKNKGVKSPHEYVDTIKNIFRGKDIGDVILRSPTVTKVNTEKVWHQTNVFIPFQFDEIGVN